VEFGNDQRMSIEDAVALATAPAKRREPPVAEAADGLSPSVREVVALIARGSTSDEIVRALVISRRTADTHAEHIRVERNT
jgi:DNA-binding NarL/FixJ family response regulator